MTAASRLGLFDAFGIELEYATVDRETLNILPIADEVLRALSGDYVSEVGRGELCWQNELVLHVIEVKTAEPAPSLQGLAEKFQKGISEMRDFLEPFGARLMPTGMHPWMDPSSETRLWAHEYSSIYQTFDRIFGCRAHGWGNVQSVHLNLPFADDEEFGRLHAAIRFVLPILPALAASSPILDAKANGVLDNRLEAYRVNARRVPSVTGSVIPEPVFTRADYERQILEPIYRDIAAHDPEGVLQHEWLNARGAIARFDRNTIEVRVLDMQECPAADMAICGLLAAVLKALVQERWAGLGAQQSFPADILEGIFRQAIVEGERTRIADRNYLGAFGLQQSESTAGEIWDRLVEELPLQDAGWQGPLEVILRQGSLSRRILAALGAEITRQNLHRVYEKLCACLEEGELFQA